MCKDLRVYQDPLALKDIKDSQASKEVKALKVFKVHKDHRVIEALKEPKVQVIQLRTSPWSRASM